MGQGRRHFTDEFKQEAIALLVSSGRPLSQIASELGISPSMLRNWRNGSGGRDAGSALRPIPASAPHSVPDRRQRSPGFAARTIGCGWSATF
jgi:Transposase and inactivated derivatives